MCQNLFQRVANGSLSSTCPWSIFLWLQVRVLLGVRRQLSPFEVCDERAVPPVGCYLCLYLYLCYLHVLQPRTRPIDEEFKPCSAWCLGFTTWYVPYLIRSSSPLSYVGQISFEYSRSLNDHWLVYRHCADWFFKSKIASTSRSDGLMTLTNSENSDQTGLESEITLGLSPLQFDLLSFEQQGFVSLLLRILFIGPQYVKLRRFSSFSRISEQQQSTTTLWSRPSRSPKPRWRAGVVSDANFR